jgi:hypothetical protein
VDECTQDKYNIEVSHFMRASGGLLYVLAAALYPIYAAAAVIFTFSVLPSDYNAGGSCSWLYLVPGSASEYRAQEALINGSSSLMRN